MSEPSVMSLFPRFSDCQNATNNGTCYDVYDRNNTFPINILYLNPDSPSCPSPLKDLLVLLAYNLIAIVVTFMFTVLRRFSWIRHWYGEVAENPRDICFLIPTGSLVVQLIFTIGSGYVLHSEDPRSDPAMLTVLWFARPLATLALLPLSLISGDLAEACELVITDFLYRLVAFGGFCAAAHATGLFSGFSLPPNTTLVGFDGYYIGLIKAGAALGILGFVGSLFFILVHALGAMRYWLWSQWRQTWWVSFLYLAGVHVFYLAASWLLWIGLLEASPAGFCPTDYAFGKLAALSIFAAVLDNLWRNFVLLLATGDPNRCPGWIIATGEQLDEAFGCFAVEEPGR